ncbi:glycoside hydrolase [Epithele typhae]|uniref:glycoside hydrolase n=1 Tax=Epithele typhae TaxID=378194 RepID=UPI002008E657|nr:glycoside hydrolase [Epithele typhae]KAH9922777.1 glycoside hydrolase [Epithele typhae]
MFCSSLLAAVLLATSFVSAAPLKTRQAAGVPKVVVAHHIVGLTAAFTVDDWLSDIKAAQANGIDGFALNVGNDPFTTTQTENAFQAAEQLNSGFKLFFSFDMSSFPCQSADGAATLRSLTLQFASRPNQLTVDGKAFVSTFAGEACSFGQSDVPTGWRTQYTQHPETTGKVHFVPSFFIDPATFNTFSGVMDGDFNFNSGWPIDLHVAQAPALLPGVDLNNVVGTGGDVALQKFIGSFDTDNQHITNLASVANSAQTYMAAVAPWFFTHFGADTFNKNFIFDGDEHLWVTRWENVIANRDKVSLVEIVTWNDFGESHYIGPQHGQLPVGSDAWVDGMDHSGFLALTNYFATQFKTGTAPAIEKDLLVMYARPHPRDAKPADPVGAPTDFQLFQDKMWAVVLATADGQLTLTDGGANTQTFPVTAGVNKLSLPIAAGGIMHGTLTRAGATVVDLKPDFTFNPNPAAFNYNAFTASATSA